MPITFAAVPVSPFRATVRLVPVLVEAASEKPVPREGRGAPAVAVRGDGAGAEAGA